MKPTHIGLFLGIVPINLDMTDPDNPMLEVRGSGVAKFLLEILMDVVEGAFALYCAIWSAIDPKFEPLYPIVITKEIHKN